MMRVLHVIPAIAARYGGPSAAVLGMCHALDEVGVETLIATTDADGPGRLPVPLGMVSTHEGQPVIFFRRRLTESFKWSGELGAWLAGNVKRFDVVHVHAVFSHSSIAAGRACAGSDVPYIVRPLGTLDPWSVNRKSIQKRVLMQFGADALLRNAAAVHYTTAEEQRLTETVIDRLPRGIVVPLGIDEDCFAAQAKSCQDTPYVLALSRLEAKKDLELLIRSFHVALSRLPTWRLVIAGDGDAEYVAKLKQLASSGPASERIEFRGWTSGEAKARLVREASLFALTSHQENFGVALVEGMAAGVPAVVTPGVNLAADIEEKAAGWVVEHTDAGVARGLEEAMQNTLERERRGTHARAFADRFHWSNVATELVAMYRAIAPHVRRPLPTEQLA